MIPDNDIRCASFQQAPDFGCPQLPRSFDGNNPRLAPVATVAKAAVHLFAGPRKEQYTEVASVIALNLLSLDADSTKRGDVRFRARSPVEPG
jgi:hypothetical protein